MSAKTCFKCFVEKPLSEFYKHKMMSDGHLNKCKECNKLDVRLNRLDKIDYYRGYDRDRGNRLPPGHSTVYNAKFPNKAFAHHAVSNAVRDGKLVRQDCEACGSSKYVHAHHDDYNKPLEVRWLCAAHHRQWHVANGEANNAV